MNSVINPLLNPDFEDVADVGALLRAARLRKGDDLRAISKVLRIRYNYLQSIESGRFDDLPGTIYSTGFIRAYAEYLGLDGKEIISKLKTESSVLADNNKLVFPTVIPEDGIPGSLIVLIGLLITVMGYCTWYWFSSPDVFVAENITTIPKTSTLKSETVLTKSLSVEENRLVEASSAVAATTKFPTQNEEVVVQPRKEVGLNTQTSLEPSQEESGSVTGPVAPKTLGGEDSSIESSRASENESSRANENESSRANEKVALVKTEQLGSPTNNVTTNFTVPQKPQPSAQTFPKTVTIGGPSVEISTEDSFSPSNIEEKKPQDQIINKLIDKNPLRSNQPAKPDPVQAAFDDSAPDTLSKLPERSDTEIATSPVSNEEQLEDKKFITPILRDDVKLDVNNPSRIIIKAKNTSWIQLRDIRTNQMILSKVLKKNQSYQIPDRPGISLMTGNAGALEITVDGEIIPKIGKLGEVRRDILMEVKSLRAGQAAVE